ncbi:hypothetical protein HUT11_35780 (plasmid) [Streptomyces seoulensis]|nr:hypothetical protein HUT11_35780 [Streptomyces seoulensis]
MISSRTVTDAVAAMLATGSGKPVGKGRQPAGNPAAYYILWRIDRQTYGAPYSDRNEDATLVYQVTSVSAPDPRNPDSFGTQDQLEWLEDKARDVILGRDPTTGLWLHTLTVPGARIISREPDTEAGGTPDPSDGIMSSASRYTLRLTSP